MFRIDLPATAGLIAALLSGCTFTHHVDIKPRTPELAPPAKSPVHAGIYYSPQFSSLEDTRTTGSHIWVVPIGAASVRLFDDMLPRVFEKTSRVSKLSFEDLRAQGIEVVVAPTLEHFDFRTGLDADSDRYSVSYRTTLYSNRGVPVESWVVFGNAPSKTMGSIWSWIEDDMSDAAGRFLQGFERNAGPALAAITKSSGAESTALDVHSVVMTAKQAELPGLSPKLIAALQEAGVVTLQVVAQSDTERRLVVRASDMRLLLKDGQVIEPSSVSSVLSILEQTSQTGGAVAALIGAPFGVLTTYLEQRSNQNERELQFRTGGQSVFEDRTLSKGKQETGIVLFRLPKGVKAAETTTLTAWVVDPSSAQGTQMEGALSAVQTAVLAPRQTTPSLAPASAAANGAAMQATSSETKAVANAGSASTKAQSSSLPQPGDTWTYNVRNGGQVVDTLKVAVVDLSATQLTETLTEGKSAQFKAARSFGLSFDPTHGFQESELPGRFFLAEFSPYVGPARGDVGREWEEIHAKLTITLGGKVREEWRLKVKVVGAERVQVPAGEFDALKVEVVSDRHRWADFGDGIVRLEFWYAPEVKRTVKMVRRLEGSKVIVSYTDVYELASYKVN